MNGTALLALQAFVSLVVLAITVKYLLGRRIAAGGGIRAKSGPPTVLITGPSNAGKTALFCAWQDPDSKASTVTSVVPNQSAQFAVLPRCRVVDCPGHERLQQYSRKELIEGNTKAVVFVVDAAAGAETIKNSAVPLIPVLEIAERDLIPVLIAVNKFDLFSALSVTKIKQLLEDEITHLRDTRNNALMGSQDDDSEERELLGSGEKFSFGDLETQVDVIDGSVAARRLSKWEEWLADLD